MGNNKSLYRLVSGTAEINRDETNHNDLEAQKSTNVNLFKN